MERSIQDLFRLIIEFAKCSRLREVNHNALLSGYGPQSHNARRFYILNLFLINKEMTYEALFPLLALISPPHFNYGSVRSLFRLFNKTFEVDVINELNEKVVRKYKNCITVTRQAYKETGITIQLTHSGVEYLKELNALIDIPDLNPNLRFTNEDYEDIFRSFNKSKDSDHKLQNIAILTTFLAFFGPLGITDFTTEVMRGRAFATNKDIMRRDTYPDIQFYSFSDAGGSHKVIVETDLGTEKVAGAKNSLVDKIAETLSYCNISTTFGPDNPITQIYVECDSKYTVTIDQRESKKLRKESKDIQDLIHFFDVAYDIIMLEHSDEFDDEYNFGTIMDKIFCSRKFFSLHQSTEEMFKFIAHLKRLDLSDSVYTRLLDRKRLMKTALYEKNSYVEFAKEMQLVAYTKDRRIDLARELSKHPSLLTRFLNGHSIYMLDKYDITENLPFIFMGNLAAKNVQAIFDYIGESAAKLSYRTSYSFIKISEREYGITLRNCFSNGSMVMAFEDISLDISAKYRIAEYLSLSSTMLKNVMLCIIIDDDEIMADGRKLKGSTYFKPDNWAGSERFDEKFINTFNYYLELPFMHRATHDFFFIHRSDFLEMQPHGFIRLGDRYFSRKAKTRVSGCPLRFNIKDNYHGSSEYNTRWVTQL